MGRKIPGRKHHGVRDPEKQRQEREKGIKDKINAPPTNIDEQHVPKSLERIMMLKEKVKTGVIPLKRKRKHKREKPISSHPHPVNLKGNGKGKPLKPTPYFEQMKGESNKTFLNRVHRITNAYIKETQFEDKYGVDVKRDENTGDVIEVVKRPKDELDIYIKEAKKNQKKKKGKTKKAASDEPKLTKSQKRKKKQLEKKESKQVVVQDFNSMKDEVGFGEVVHAPPTLTAPRRVQSLNCAPRPGQKDLLLKAVMYQNEKNTQEKISTPINKKKNEMNKTSNKVIDKKGKRKELPVAMRRQLEKQQQEVIQAYKLLKKQKLNAVQ